MLTEMVDNNKYKELIDIVDKVLDELYIKEKYLFDKWGIRKLSRLTPYLLIGKNQEATAREHGWLRSKGALEGGLNKPIDVNVYSLSGYKGKEEKVVNDFSDTL